MEVSEPPHSYAQTLTGWSSPASSGIQNAGSIPAGQIPNMGTEGDTQGSSLLGLFGRLLLFILRVIPGALYWLITFTTITLPTWLFTLFSMSLTFTMNFTTL
jgi:lysophospholipid hydrolase